MLERINNILANWNLTALNLPQQYKTGGGRLVYNVDTTIGKIILKGQPLIVSENVVLNIIRIHEFLGNKHHLAPKIYYQPNGSALWTDDTHYYYVMEFICGRTANNTPKDWAILGNATAQLHSLIGYDVPCSFNTNEDIQSFKNWYTEKPWKTEFDAIVNGLPNFNNHAQCLIHSDIGPANTLIRDDNSVAFIDLDSAGIGSQFVDLGWPFITHFVHYSKHNAEMAYKHELASSFLKSYYSRNKLTATDYELMWQGAAYSHIYNMQWSDETNIMWEKLKFGLQQKNILLESLR